MMQVEHSPGAMRKTASQWRVEICDPVCTVHDVRSIKRHSMHWVTCCMSVAAADNKNAEAE